MQRIAYAALTASVVLALSTYVWRGTYTRYVTDDFATVAPALLIVAALISSWSGIATTRTLPAARRDAAHADRIAALLRPRIGQDVFLRSSRALQSAYIENNPTHRANDCICHYYGLRSLRVVR